MFAYITELKNISMKNNFDSRMLNFCGDPIDLKNIFNVELINGIISSMTIGKAAGYDGLMIEHIKYAHPTIILILVKLFNLMIIFSYVPKRFGEGLTIPIPKQDSLGNFTNLNDYRGITISPVISKIFEHCVLKTFSNYLGSSKQQFGFKRNVGCSQPVFLVRQTVEYFIKNDSTVNICTMDLSKAFDKVNIYGLFVKLIDRNVPACLVKLLKFWYTNSHMCIRWGNAISTFHNLQAGVRQGGVLSPTLFSIYVNDILDKLAKTHLGCYIKKQCLSILMYADDIIILTNSITDLQKIVNYCTEEFNLLDLSINCKKSACLRIGPRYKKECISITSNGSAIPWCKEIKYLGVFIAEGKTFRCNFDSNRVKFYRSFNCLYSKIGKSQNPSVILSLLTSYSLPVLLYGLDSVSTSTADMQRLNLAYNRSFMKIFNTYNSEIIAQCQFYSSMLPLRDYINQRKISLLVNLKNDPDLRFSMVFKQAIEDEMIAILNFYDCSLNCGFNLLKCNMWKKFETSTFT